MLIVPKTKMNFLSGIGLRFLVNPLQNLPLISGIYSDVNSENEESDRDLVQNSLGGFLYGGPFWSNRRFWNLGF